MTLVQYKASDICFLYFRTIRSCFPIADAQVITFVIERDSFPIDSGLPARLKYFPIFLRQLSRLSFVVVSNVVNNSCVSLYNNNNFSFR